MSQNRSTYENQRAISGADGIVPTEMASGFKCFVTGKSLGCPHGLPTCAEKGVRYRKPERPKGCFAFSVPDPFFPDVRWNPNRDGLISSEELTAALRG
jgi:hypothetical protein